METVIDEPLIKARDLLVGTLGPVVFTGTGVGLGEGIVSGKLKVGIKSGRMPFSC